MPALTYYYVAYYQVHDLMENNVSIPYVRVINSSSHFFISEASFLVPFLFLKSLRSCVPGLPTPFTLVISPSMTSCKRVLPSSLVYSYRKTSSSLPGLTSTFGGRIVINSTYDFTSN